MTTITVFRPQAVGVPRAAQWAAQAFMRLLGALERAADERTRRHRALAQLADAARVRAYAVQVAAVDPGFAADLLAAADRHVGE